MPATSVTCVMRREPSLSRDWWTINWIAELICSRTDLGDRSMPAINVIVSSLLSESRGEFEWTVLIEPS